ncbi:MAG: HAD family hydrolase [Chlamydiia bacterium]|nr:HAD family hydrolase [Chlamydiia bacterium]
MYIIFDLDDTLIDTSGSITPKALKWALSKIGDQFPLEELLELNDNASSSEEAIQTFLTKHHSLEYIELAKNALDHYPIETVTPLANALEVVRDLAQDHTLAVVTAGRHAQQLLKFEKAGFSKNDFFSIDVTQMRSKKLIYQHLQKKWNVDPVKIFVVGDRIATDLQPAKELGMQTVHMRWGRGRNNTGLKTDVDYTIDTLTQLKTIAYDHKA